MGYKEKYEQALARARKYLSIPGHPSRREINNIFPELATSKDERIRESIIHLVKREGGEFGFIDVNTSVEEALAWLEKQGEQKVNYTTLVETGNGGINALVTRELPTNGCGEQKSAWSEEDEEMLRSIIATCELTEADRDSSPARHLLEMQINWLKSLKQRMGD